MNFHTQWRGYFVHTSFSDHYAVGLQPISAKDIGPKLWQFPSDLLSDEAFNSQIWLILDGFNGEEAITSWEHIKDKIRTLSQSQTSYRQRQMKNEFLGLRKTLCYINKRIFHGENLEIDRLQLESKIDQIKEHASFDRAE